MGCEFAATGSLGQDALLDEEGLVHLFDGVVFFADRDGKSFQADGAAAVHGKNLDELAVEGGEAGFVDAEPL